MRRRSLFPLLAVLLLSPPVSSREPVPDTAAPREPPKVEVFSPQEMVKGVRQVAVRFTRQMVPFGDPRLVEPFDVNCPATGKARWADARNWVYDFDADLPAGVQCTFTLKPDLKTLDGQALTGESTFSVSTGGPSIAASMPYEGNTGIDEEQIFILGLDAPATKESIQQHVYCDVAGVSEKIGVRLLEDEERKSVLAVRKDFLNEYYRVLTKDGEGRISVFIVQAPLTGTDQEKFLQLKDSEESPIVVLQCQRRFPPNVDVKLIWGRGVASTGGIATREEQTLAFHTREEFRASFNCERVNKDAHCMPILPMYLSFTAPIARADAEKIVLQPEDGDPVSPTFSEDNKEEWVQGVIFAGPFPERAKFTLKLPDALKDDAGRVLVNQDRFPLATQTDEAPPLAKFAAQFGIVELNPALSPDEGGAALPVTLRNLESLLPLPTLPKAGETPASIETAPDAPMESTDITAEPWYRRWYQTFRERYWPEAAEINGRSLRVDDAVEAIGWMQRVKASQQSRGHYDYEHDRYIVEQHPGERSLFDTDSKMETFTLPKPHGKRAFEVIGIPFSKPGFYVVELASPRLGAALYGKQAPYHVQSSVLVTNMAVHFKKGRESSLVWVTTLDRAEPVADAEVKVGDCGGYIYAEGRTDKDGLLHIEQALPQEDELPQCPEYNHAFLVTARAGEDMTFTLSSWNEGINPWRFNLPTANWDTPNLVTTVFARTLLRAGETVHMKHYARRHGRDGFSVVSAAELPDKATIRHQGSDQQYEVALSWDAHGIAESIWTIPNDAKQGTYNVSVSIKDPVRGEIGMDAGSFRVEAYRVPTMRAVLQPVEADLVKASQADVDVQVNYLSGGGAGGAPVKLRGLVRPKYVYFEDYEDFTFANGNVKEGREEDSAYRYGGYAAEEPASDSQPLAAQELQLDRAGALRATLSDLPRADTPRDVLAELEYRDPNGETLTSATHLTLWPAAIMVGLKPDAWAVSKDNLKFHALALDLKGKPIKDAKVKVDLLQRIIYSHRKRLVGGFYAYEHHAEVKRIGDLCAGTTDDKGLLICEVKSPVDGNLILRAQIADAAGNVSYANREVWVAASGDWWFDVGNEDRMDLLPEKKRYEPGETATLQVRMPFREATALVSVEREGVMETTVQPLSGKSPVVKVPIKGNHAPNVFVSVLAVRGRVDDVKPTALVDLGKPAYKLGIAELKVGWQAHELKVSASADRDVYKVRETSKVKIKVTRANGEPLPEGAEIALAAVDEGLLELLPNDSWKLLEAMMGRRGIEVQTSTAQMQVIGKRHYGRKAMPAGGGGGRQNARELFDTLLKWQGRVKLDASGEADIEVPLNDSLTSFRIVAVVNAAAGLFGTGSTTIRSTQDLMLLSGLPPLVREGDRFLATFTVRNASDKAMDPVTVTATPMQTAGAEKPEPLSQVLPPIALSLAPGEAKEVGWDVEVPIDAEKITWEIAVNDGDSAGDRLKVAQKVIPAVRVRTWQATLTQIAKPLTMDAKIPADAIPGRGGVRVTLKPSLAGQLAGVKDYMRAYPYTCLEQRVSRAIALRDENLWRQVMNELPSYLDSDGLVRYFPVLYQGDDTLTAYVLAIAAEAGWEIPEDARQRTREALIRFAQGQVTRGSALPTADLSIRKMAALEAASRYDSIDPALLTSFSIEPNLWPTSAVLDWINVLTRTGQVEQQQQRLEQAKQILRSRLNFQGTTMGFSTEREDFLWWLMISADSNANRAILNLLDDPQWQEDLPRMVRGSLGRQLRGHWSTTVANAWGVVAMEKFAAKFEGETVSGLTASDFGGHQEWHWERKPDGGSLYHPWPPADSDAQMLAIAHKGSGRPWAMIQSLVAIPLKEPFSSGYTIKRTVTPVEQKAPGSWSRGDVARVRLELEAQSDMTWVVVNDPIPAGASILGTGLSKDSQIMTQGEQRQGYVWPAFEERTFDSFRAYYEFVPKGKWVLEYTVRLNNPGTFEMPETRVEALYAPEMFGESPNATVTVTP